MASVTKLVIEFATADGESVTMSYNYIRPTIEAEDVSDIVNTIVANGSIFEKVPSVPKSAKLVTTTETDIELNA